MKKLQLTFAAVALIFGLGLLTAGFILPPPGEIHSSVLVAYGETLTFVGSIIGVDYRYRYKNENHDSQSHQKPDA